MFRLSPPIVSQGSPAELADAWPVKVTDGVSVLGTPSNPFSVSLSAGSQQSIFGPVSGTQSLVVDTQGSGTCVVQILGTWVGTLSFQATVDGSNWVAVNGTDPLTGLQVTNTTSNGLWAIPCAGFLNVQVLGNTVTSGTANVYLSTAMASQVVNIGNPSSGGGGSVDVTDRPARLVGIVTANVGTTGGLALDATVTNRLNTLGQKVSATSAPVVIASDQSPIPISGTITATPSTSTASAVTIVAGSISNVTLLAANPLRKGFTVQNDSTSILYLKLGTGASSSSYSVKMQPDSYFEDPFAFQGEVDGVWVSATGNALVSELT